MKIEEQIANLSQALDKETNNRKKGFMRYQLRQLEYRLNQIKG
jgi:hypothetical protein